MMLSIKDIKNISIQPSLHEAMLPNKITEFVGQS